MAQHKKAILHTFQEMLRKQPFDTITVSALVAKSEVSPNTFYYHYRDICDLPDTWLRTVQEEDVSEIDERARWQDAMKSLPREMKANSDLIFPIIFEEKILYIFDMSGSLSQRLLAGRTGPGSGGR